MHLGRTNRRRRKSHRSNLYMIVAVIMLMLGALTVKRVTLDANCQKLETQRAELEAKKQSLLDEKESIEKQAEYMQTPKYIEDVAREKLGLVYKNEVIFKAETK